MNKILRSTVFLAILGLSLISPPAIGNSFKASVRIWVTTNGVVLPGAKVNLQGGSYNKTFTSDQYGRVLFIGLHPGEYHLTVQFPWFEDHRTPLNFRVGSTLNYQADMQYLSSGCRLNILYYTMPTIRRTWRLEKKGATVEPKKH